MLAILCSEGSTVTAMWVGGWVGLPCAGLRQPLQPMPGRAGPGRAPAILADEKFLHDETAACDVGWGSSKIPLYTTVRPSLLAPHHGWKG